ncbi:DsrE family protein [Flavihumibacter sp. UBA7668]|uniref:DsrE family protein n=1 Tax=Flavihumibacter sp. UBA7668 TaxID=1946542 RepID=UPI0025C2319F|nr:DsrE family protein [Flavihumibacter sp. UBA7668]
MRKILLLFLVVFIGTINPAGAQSAAIKHRLVIQLNTGDTLIWNGMMKNLKNLKAGWGDSVQVEVVVHGPGIQFMMKEKTTQAIGIATFKKMGIEFVVCENTMRERNVSKEQLLPEAGFVKMGVGEIILKQEAGWSYMKM